jgi:hypothetical protein
LKRSEARIREEQEALCKHYGAKFTAAPGESKSGFALSTKGLFPINGLRHSPVGDTSGWYIWCGEQFSDRPEFFASLHTIHLYEEYPAIAKFLGLPPGYRFLLAGEYLDVWYDESLLNI